VSAHQKNKNFVLENGANAVIEYNKENYIEDLNKLNIKFDLIYDTIDSKSIKEDYYNIFKGYLKENEGFYISINGKGAFKTFPHIIKTLFGKENKNTKIKFFLLLYGRYVKDLEILLKYVNEGKLKPNLNIFEFNKESVQKGIDLLASHRTTGKIVFEINK